MSLRAEDIHARVTWPAVLIQLGIGEQFLRLKKAGPCPNCGGRDRYTFDNRKGRGDFICRGCGGAGDGFELLKRVHGWQFPEARKRVMEAAGIADARSPRAETVCRREKFSPTPPEAPPSPPARVLTLRRQSCAVADCPEVVAYLESRGLWPLTDGCTLRAHPSAPYYQEGRLVARFAAVLADVVDVSGELASVHVTYLQNGQKLAEYEPRKLLSPLGGHDGCAVRLMPLAGDTLGVAEGIETALSASALEHMPVWAALNTSLLAKFEPPLGVARLVLYADHDAAGLSAALRLFERLQGRIRIEARIPTAHAKDFNDVLQKRGTP